MTRRIVWIALVLIAAGAAGLLLAVLVPRDSDDLPPPVTILDTTATIPAAEPTAAALRVFSAREVRSAFRRHGLPLREVPTGGHTPRLFMSPKAGPIFNVSLFRTPTAAAAAAAGNVFVLRPAGYRFRGHLMTKHSGNVVVTFEEGRTVVRNRLMAALAGLD